VIDVYVESDRRRLERVLGNPVVNAHQHGRPPVAVTVEGPVVTVRDHGEGCPPYLLERGPQRFRTEGGAAGHGLGPAIALGQAMRCWAPEWSSATARTAASWPP
jgi:signal transduction histidine kinase